MSQAPSISKGAAQPKLQYRIEGQGSQDFELLALRDQIRNGTLQPENQVMIVGTDVWKPASQYPALQRYFSLVKPSGPAASAPGAPVESMGNRIAIGLAYPFSSVSSIALVAAAFAAGLLFPLLSLVVSVVASIYALGIIRKSSEGQTSAPTFSDVGGPLDWIAGFLRIIAVTLISLWPVFVAAFIQVSGWANLLKFLVAVVVVILYYPASLATVAIWKSLKMALSVQQIFRFIGTLGADYYAVIGMWFLSIVLIGMELNVAGHFLPRVVISAVNATASLYLTMYASHLLGWAVYRRRDQL